MFGVEHVLMCNNRECKTCFFTYGLQTNVIVIRKGISRFCTLCHSIITRVCISLVSLVCKLVALLWEAIESC